MNHPREGLPVQVGFAVVSKCGGRALAGEYLYPLANALVYLCFPSRIQTRISQSSGVPTRQGEGKPAVARSGFSFA